MKEVKFYCDFCDNEITEEVANGEYESKNTISISIVIEFGEEEKDACLVCLIKILKQEQDTKMINKVMRKNPVPMKRKSAIDNGEDDF